MKSRHLRQKVQFIPSLFRQVHVRLGHALRSLQHTSELSEFHERKLADERMAQDVLAFRKSAKRSMAQDKSCNSAADNLAGLRNEAVIASCKCLAFVPLWLVTLGDQQISRGHSYLWHAFGWSHQNETPHVFALCLSLAYSSTLSAADINK